jgi:hypothetical protein
VHKNKAALAGKEEKALEAMGQQAGDAQGAVAAKLDEIKVRNDT